MFLKSERSEYEWFKQLAHLRCRIHDQSANFFEITCPKECNDDTFGLKIKCLKCNRFTDNNQMTSIDLKVLKFLTQITDTIDGNFDDEIQEVKKLKNQISNILKTRFTRKTKYQSFWTLLTDFNRDFLSKSEPYYQKQFETIEIQEFKKWLKDPQKFEDSSNLNMSKYNLKAFLNIKYHLVKCMNSMRIFLKRSGLICKGKYFCRDLFGNNLLIFSEIVRDVANLKKKEFIEGRIFSIESMLYMIKSESSIQEINKYIKKFINLHNSFRMCSPKAKFKVSREILVDFCLNIEKSIVILKNPDLNFGKNYNTISYQSQFILINDGQFIFENEYRPDIFCNDSIHLERDENTMIGSQFFSQSPQAKDSEGSGRMIEIKEFLKSESKIRLKLSLNSEQFDLIGIRILRSSSFDNFLKNQKDCIIGFNIKIVPDEGDNFKLLNFPRIHDDEILRQQLGKNQYNQAMVLQDDIISLSFNENQTKIICLNETRSLLIWQQSVQRPLIKVKGCMELEVQLNVGIVLFSTIPQVIILNDDICPNSETLIDQ